MTYISKDDLQKLSSRSERGIFEKTSKFTRLPRTTVKYHARGKYQDKVSVTREVVKNLAIETAKQSGRRSRFNYNSGSSHKCVRYVLNRHLWLSLRKRHSLEKEQSATKGE